MKKILFVIPDFWLAGTNKSLESLISILDKNKYEVSVFSIFEDGENHLKKVFSPYLVKKSFRYHYLHDNYYSRKIYNIYKKIRHQDKSTLCIKEIQRICDTYKYDAVVAYSEGSVTEHLSLVKTSAKKFAWVHCFYGDNTKDVYNVNRDLPIYKSYNNVICVSNEAAKAFMKQFPSIKERVLSIYNIINVDSIIKASKIPINDKRFKKDFFSILSVGHMYDAKRLHLIPEFAKKIVDFDNTIRFKWYVIGANTDKRYYDVFCEDINKYKIEDYVQYLGVKDNPYKYMANCNLVVCPSTSESFSYVINEALILKVPVVSKDFPVAIEMIPEGMGVVSDYDNLPEHIYNLIINKGNLYSSMKKRVESHIFDNKSQVKIINELFDASQSFFTFILEFLLCSPIALTK